MKISQKGLYALQAMMMLARHHHQGAIKIRDSAYEEAHTLARTFPAAQEDFLRDGVAVRLLGERFVKGYASVKDVEYESWLAEIGAWERRFLVPQA